MTIKETSRMYDVSPDTLRYYEKIGLLPPVRRGANGIRDYGEAELNWIEFIMCMKSAGLTIEVLTEYVQLCMKGEETIEERKRLLQEQRRQLAQRLEEMQATLKKLDHKIEIFENTLTIRERELVQAEARAQ